MQNKIKKERVVKVKKEKKSEVVNSNKVKTIEVEVEDVISENTPEIKETEKKEEKKASSVTKVGTLLKNVRLEKGLKLVDIAKTLCIRKQYLEAIEDNNYNEIPAFPYGIGFIRSYANFLGLNSENITELYKEETAVEDSPKIIVNEDPANSNMPGFIYLVISVVAMIVIYGIWKIWNNENNDINDNNTYVAEEVSNDNNDIVVIEETNIDSDVATDTSSENIETPEESNFTNKTTDNIESTPIQQQSQTKEDVKSETLVIPEKGIFIEVLEESWIEVKTDTKLYLSKVLHAGDSYKLPNDAGLILSVGKLGGVNIYVNGKKTDLAQTGKKMNIDIDAYLKANH